MDAGQMFSRCILLLPETGLSAHLHKGLLPDTSGFEGMVIRQNLYMAGGRRGDYTTDRVASYDR
jgi:hypothetical protein